MLGWPAFAALPSLKKKKVFSIFPEVIFLTFWGSRWPHLGTQKNAKFIFQGDFWGAQALPPWDRPSCRFPKKKSNASSGKPFFSERGVRCSPQGGALWDPQKIKNSQNGPFGGPIWLRLGSPKITLKNYRKNTWGLMNHLYGSARWPAGGLAGQGRLASIFV